MHPLESYRNADDDRPDEKRFEHLGKTFPHRLHHARPDVYHSALRYTPYADELLLLFVKELVTRERLGQQEHVDLLAVSFSATDYIQHAWGVNSLEAEDNLLRLDGTLADLFGFLAQEVGLSQTLIVLSADHGFDDIPEARQRLGLDAGRHDPARIIARANDVLRAHHHTSRDFVSAFLTPSLYLDLDVVQELGLDVAALEQELAEAVRDQPGIAGAATRTDLMSGRVPDDPIARSLQWSFHPQRSGNVLIFQSENWYLYNDPNSDAAMHGSPYRYDTHVPILFAGPGIRYAVVSRPVGPEDVAPTIAAYLGIDAPSGSVGTVLPEVVGD